MILKRLTRNLAVLVNTRLQVRHLSSILSDADAKKAAERFDEIRTKHLEFRDNYGDQSLEIHKRKLIYRSNQRGLREVDLLLGRWAKQNVPAMNEVELKDFEKIVNLETLEILKILTVDRAEIPDELWSDVLNRMRQEASSVRTVS